jgi:gas vesicle protein
MCEDRNIMKANNTEGSGNLGWFLVGALIGVAGAIILAPKSGKDTRDYLVKTTSEGKDSMGESGRELLERGRDLYERGKKIAEDASDLFERGRKLVQG